MADVEKVKEGLRVHSNPDNVGICPVCPYHKRSHCVETLCFDSLNLISELQAEIARFQPKKGKWIFTGQKNAYGGTVIQCPFCDDKYVVAHPCNEHYCRNCGAYFGGDDKNESH